MPKEFFEHKIYMYNLLKSTILNGENNSAMIIGPRASGKTMVFDETIYFHSTPDIFMFSWSMPY